MAAVTTIAEFPATAVVARKTLSGNTFSGSSAKAAENVSRGSYKY